MKYLINILQQFKQNKAGATAIEYGLIAALIAIGIIGGASAIGNKVNTQFDCTSQRIDRAGQDKADIRFRNCVRRGGG